MVTGYVMTFKHLRSGIHRFRFPCKLHFNKFLPKFQIKKMEIRRIKARKKGCV